MPHVSFTSNLRQHVACPEADVQGSTVGAALGDYFATHGLVRDYVLDEHGAVRKHMAVFVDGEMISDRERLSDPVGPRAKIWVIQALSGG
ncbi:MAG: MoaD/ThiS family protein [Planctomycetota bacterium]|nr:MoaD/ThiS family protein [Planctomycetota bacterium]